MIWKDCLGPIKDIRKLEGRPHQVGEDHLARCWRNDTCGEICGQIVRIMLISLAFTPTIQSGI